jgi:hypothetical protein
MPKLHKKGGNSDGDKSKGKGKKGDVVRNKADDDFDSMLADLRASDLLVNTTNNTTTATGSSSSSSSSSSGSSSTAPAAAVTKAMIVQASVRGDVTKLRRWVERGVRVSSAEPLCNAVFKNNIGAVRCLVKELGADVDQAGEEEFTPLISHLSWVTSK